MRIWIVLFIFGFHAHIAFAQCPSPLPSGIDCVGSGANKDITAFSVCSNITNNHALSKALMVPVNSSTEWSTFRTNLPTGVTSGSCGGGGDGPAGVTHDMSVSGTITNTGTSVSTSSGISTTYNNELLIAYVSCFSSVALTRCAGDVTSVTGGGLTWTLIGYASNTNVYDFAIFRAWAATPISNQVITGNMSTSDSSTRNIVVSSYWGTDQTGSNGSGAVSIGGPAVCTGCTTTSMSQDIYSTRDGSLVTTSYDNEGAGVTVTAGANTVINATGSGTYNTLSAYRKNATTSTAGTKETLAITTSAAATPSTIVAEILAPIVPVSNVTFDQSFAADTGTGGNSMSIPVSSAEANELVLLAITYKSTGPLTTAPAWFGSDPAYAGTASGWTLIGTVAQGTTNTTELWRSMTTSKLMQRTLLITLNSSLKATAAVALFRGVNTSGTNGSGAIDAWATGTNTTLNPSLSVTPATNNSLVIGVLGNGNATAPTAGTGFTRKVTISSSGGGAAGTKTTTTFEVKNALSSSGSAVSVPFTLGAIDWTGFAVSIKP